jgi:hypothetical protein
MKVFLSYADSERKLARELAERLVGAGIRVWWDDAEISAGENWAGAIQLALQEADALVVLLSPDAVRSRWVRREVDYALATPRFAHRIVPVQVKPTPDAPWFLQSLPSVRATRDLDQVAREIVGALVPSEN